MTRLGVSKKKKSPRATELSQLKKELQSVSEQLESCKRELAEGRERETATSEILREIASSPTDIQPVLDVVVECAAKLCAANDAVLLRLEGDSLRPSAHCGPMPTLRGPGQQLSIGRGTVHGRAIIERKTIHIEDIATEIEN